jgi:nucleoside-diphosphate-sugar epimerase
MGSKSFFVALLSGRPPILVPPVYVDIRDTARAHVAAMKLPPQSPVQKKRIFIAGPGFLRWKDVAQYLAETRVELRGRLPSLDSIPDYPGPPSTIIVQRAKELLGMEEYIDWKQTVDDTVDDVLKFENTWDSAQKEVLVQRKI